MSYRLHKRKPRMLTENLFTKVDVYVPNSTYEILTKMSEEKFVPRSRLIAIALDNELDVLKPFNYPCELPTDEYKEFMYAKEAGAIMKWLAVTNGVNIESIMLCRRDFGLTSREDVLYALRDLFKNEMIEEFKPSSMTSGYKPGQKRIRVTKETKRDIKIIPGSNPSNREETDDEQS